MFTYIFHSIDRKKINKFILKCIVICILILLFFCSFSYKLIVYLSKGRKELKIDLKFEELCHPYSNGQEISPAVESLLQKSNISVANISRFYTDHSMCLDLLLPAFCQTIIYPIANEGSDMSGEDDVFSITLISELQEECSSVLPNQLLLFFAHHPTDYSEDITCADGFYLLNYTCRPHCTQFEQIYHSSATTKIGFVYFATIFNVIFTSLFIVAVLIKRKTVFKFPSILFVYLVLLYSVWPISILINLFSGRTLVCSDDDLIKSVQQPSPYCVISGILSIASGVITIFWIILVAVMFWKLVFPSYAYQYRNIEKWIHALAIVLVIIYVIPFIVTITADEDFYSVQSGFPSFFCLSRNVDFFFGYLLFPAVFLSSLGMFLLLFILFHIQLKYGCSIWRNDDAINAAEKKLLLLACFVGGVSTISGIYYTFLLSRNNELQAALTSYFLCELPGYIMDNENDMITCSKDEIVKYSYTGLSIAYTVFTYALLPLVFLLAIIEWKSSIQKMKELLHMKNKNNELSASNLAQLNRSNDVSNTLILGNSFADTK